MAIHVRSKQVTKKKLAAVLRRMLGMAFCAALLALLLGGLSLYIKKIFTEDSGQSSFTAYETPQETAEEPTTIPTPEDLASSASAGAAAPDTSAILTSSQSDISVAADLDIGDVGEGLADGTGTDDGFGLGDLGDGGLGDGLATHNPGSDNGGGKGQGYNDDIQVVLLLDASGSMDQLFVAASQSMENVLTTLSKAKLNGKKTKVNVGIVVYGQMDGNGAPYKLSPFTTQVRKIRTRLEKVKCDGALEECGAAIDFAVRNFEWNRRDRDDMLKVIFIAGNESFAQGNIDYHTAIAAAAEQNIIVNTIHCGAPDMEWEEAAALGKGVGLTLDLQHQNAPKASVETLLHVLQALHSCKPLPVGPPAVQRTLIDAINKAPAPPNGKNEKQLQKWLQDNKERILSGYEWDAIEIYRLMGQDAFSISLLGGQGNLPISLRGKSEEEITDFLRQEADKRTHWLNEYKSIKASGDLGTKMLQALQEQALEKGITIDIL